MGRAPCCDKDNVKRGPWSPEEDHKLKSYIEQHGTGGNWIALPQKVGLKRCGKSCRLRWLNYLRPNIKHGRFTEEEDDLICSLYIAIGSRWSIIAAQLPGRTDNDIKNYWNTRLRKKLLGRQRRQQQQQSKKSQTQECFGKYTQFPYFLPPECYRNSGNLAHVDQLQLFRAGDNFDNFSGQEEFICKNPVIGTEFVPFNEIPLVLSPVPLSLNGNFMDLATSDVSPESLLHWEDTSSLLASAPQTWEGLKISNGSKLISREWDSATTPYTN